MRLIKFIILLVLTGSLLDGCIDPYDPGDLKFENMLFIEASITDDPNQTPYVRFTHAYPFSENNYEGEPLVNTIGATIYVENTKGQRFYFIEGSSWGWWGPPYYYLDDPAFVLEEGESYMLYIETSDGHIFESQFEKYMPSPPVEEITYRYDTWEEGQSGEQEEGYRFYISSSAPDQDPLYLRWIADATWSFLVPFRASHYWDGQNLIDSTNNDRRFCYDSENIEGIFTGTSEGLAVNRVSEIPLHGVSSYGYRLQTKYSLHVRQMRISQSAYRFWKDLDALLYESGGLYETIPFRMTGNISCVSHEDISVAGIFELAGVSETRVFVDRPTEFTVTTQRCILDTVGTPSMRWNNLPSGSWIMEGDPGVYFTGPLTCFDCTARGGFTSTPSFWE